MLNIYPVIVGPIETNCYLVANTVRETIIIDPGAEPEVIRATLEREELKPLAILITHGHYDHILAAPALGQHYTIPIWYPEKDHYLLSAEKAVGILPKDFELPNVHYYDGTLLQESFSIEVIHTPGHTKGQSCFLIEDNLFSGDMLFAEGYLGRTDLWGGSAEEIQSSLKKLLTLANEIRVFPGHGQASTIGIERGYHE